MSKTRTKKAAAPKPKRGVGQAITRQRRKIAERQDFIARARIDRERDLAEALVQAQRQISGPESEIVRNYHNYTHACTALANNHRALHTAIGLKDIEIDFQLRRLEHSHNDSRPPEAYTNFTKVYVRADAPAIGKSTVRDFIVQMRGVLHHETGHCRFTLPYKTLIDRLDESHPLSTLSKVAFRTWNLLEDQRMETAVVSATPRIAQYFVPMVSEIVLGQSNGSEGDAGTYLFPWLAVAGRQYLPSRIREIARERFDEYTKGRADEWYDIVKEYRTATTDVALADAIIRAHHFINAISEGVESGVTNVLSVLAPTSMHLDDVDGEEFDEQIIQRAAEANEKAASKDEVSPKQEAPAPKQEAPKAEESNDTAGGTDAAGDGDDDTDEDDSSENGSDADGDAGDQGGDNNVATSVGNGALQDLRELLSEAAEEAHQKASQSAEVDAIVADAHQRMGTGTVPVENNESWHVPMAESERVSSLALAASLYETLDSFRTAKSAALLHRQEEGYLDPLAYRTREPGEVDYHNNFVNLDSNGLGLHVTLLADRSSSMTWNMRSLSVVTYALHKACQDLGIPSTIIMWADWRETGRVYEDSDEPVVFKPLGGTSPRRALNDMDTHVKDDNLHHLVFVFTDGEWRTHDAAYLNRLKKDDRTIVLIGLDCEYALRKIPADVTINIPHMHMLGGLIHKMLADHLAGV